jgi:hypothetical protein
MVKQRIRSYDFNLYDIYEVEEVTGTFYKLTNADSTPPTVYVPKTENGINDYVGGYKQSKTRRNNRKNCRKSNRRR